MKCFMIFMIFFQLISFSKAQIVERSVTIENPDTTGKVPVSQMTEQANLKMAEDLVLEYVGAEGFARNKALLTSKVIKNSSKFTPYQKALEPDQGLFGVRLTVQYKINLTEFRKLLTESGLFSKTRLAHHVVSFLSIEDESGQRQVMSWKKNTNQESAAWLNEWNDEFKKVFEKAGYSFNKNLNPAWLDSFSENISAQDVLNKSTMAQSFLLWGTGRIVKNDSTGEKRLVMQTKFYSQDFKREVSDSARRFNLKDDGHHQYETWAQDLVAQLDEVDLKSLSSEPLMKLIVRGAIPLFEQDQFKQVLANSSTLIKSISERRFESNQITYEVETNASTAELVQKLKNVEWKGQKLKSEFNQNEIRMEIL